MVRKANPALLKPLNLSAELEAVVGKGPMSRGQVVSKIWEYIKADEFVNEDTGKKGTPLRKGATLQNQQNKRNIFADDKLMPIFKKKEVTMFEMTKLVSGHMS
jgi:upstream activation factor subunit UAF30